MSRACQEVHVQQPLRSISSVYRCLNGQVELARPVNSIISPVTHIDHLISVHQHLVDVLRWLGPRPVLILSAAVSFALELDYGLSEPNGLQLVSGLGFVE